MIVIIRHIIGPSGEVLFSFEPLFREVRGQTFKSAELPVFLKDTLAKSALY